MIQTERLHLREFKNNPQDINALYEILSDETINRYLPMFPLKNRAEAQRYFKAHIKPRYENNDGYYFAICFKENSTPIGYISVSGSIPFDFGYALRTEYWNQGIVTEAAEAVIHYLRDHDYEFITATHDIDNISSGKVMEKLGMTYHYSYKEQWQPKDVLVTFRLYQLNLNNPNTKVYIGYKEKYPEHFVESL